MSILKKTEKIEKIENYFTKQYFVEDFKIPDNKIEEFINFCYFKYQLDEYLNKNNFEYIEGVLKQEAINYNLLFK